MKSTDVDRSLHRAVVVALCCYALALGSAPLRAGDLNAEVNNMFNSLGAIGNYVWLDEDGDGTHRGWRIPYPAFDVNPDYVNV